MAGSVHTPPAIPPRVDRTLYVPRQSDIDEQRRVEPGKIAVPVDAIRNKHLSNGAVMCYSVILSCLPEGYLGGAFLQSVLGKTERTVRNYVMELVEAGYLTRKTGSPSKVISNDVARFVFERDDYRCVFCGDRFRITVDHIFPQSKGGTSEPDNLQTLCLSCNSRKGARI